MAVGVLEGSPSSQKNRPYAFYTVKRRYFASSRGLDFKWLPLINYQRVRWDHHVTTCFCSTNNCWWSLESLAYWFPEPMIFQSAAKNSGRYKDRENKTPLCDSDTTVIQYLDHPPPSNNDTHPLGSVLLYVLFSHKTLSSASHVT